MGNQIFISYRRKDGFYPAYLLYKELIAENFSVFFDLKSLRSGTFPDIIRQNIDDCTDFVLIVSDSTFSERIFDEDDWVRKELSLALKLNKNVVPVFVNGSIPDNLPEDIAAIRGRNGLQQIDPNLISENYKKLIDERLVSKPQEKAFSWKMRRSSAYDVNYGDEKARLAIQSQNSYSSDMNVLSHYGGGLVLDVGSAFGTVTISRFNDSKYTKVFGIDRDEKCVDYANANSPEKFEFFVMDIEADDFRAKMDEFMRERGIKGFDVVFSSLVLHHLKDPEHVLRNLRRLLVKGGKIILRGSDDGTKLAYPDPRMLMKTIIDKTLACPNTSDRLNGRKLYNWLSEAGFSDISIFSFMRDTSQMNMDEREDLFRESFSYRVNYFRKDWEAHPGDSDKFHAFDEMETLLAMFENEFMKESFWYAEYDYIGVGER